MDLPCGDSMCFRAFHEWAESNNDIICFLSDWARAIQFLDFVRRN